MCVFSETQKLLWNLSILLYLFIFYVSANCKTLKVLIQGKKSIYNIQVEPLYQKLLLTIKRIFHKYSVTISVTLKSTNVRMWEKKYWKLSAEVPLFCLHIMSIGPYSSMIY